MTGAQLRDQNDAHWYLHLLCGLHQNMFVRMKTRSAAAVSSWRTAVGVASPSCQEGQ